VNTRLGLGMESIAEAVALGSGLGRHRDNRRALPHWFDR
jgi:hypothetical protein